MPFILFLLIIAAGSLESLTEKTLRLTSTRLDALLDRDSVTVASLLMPEESDVRPAGWPAALQDIGYLDLNPEPRILSGLVDSEQPDAEYQFELQAASTVNMRLTGLTKNADLYLGDSQGKLIARSVRTATKAENIQTDLEPGIYFIRVRSVEGETTPFDLSLQADFITNDAVVSRRNQPIRDPEFDEIGNQVAWIDDADRLLVAPVDPATGNFLLNQQVVVDTGLAPFLENGIQNGPEWTYSQAGSQIVYTLLMGRDWYLGRARRTPNGWEAGALEDSRGGHVPFGSLNPEDTNPLVKYSLGSPVTGPRQATAWRELDNAAVGGTISGPGATGGRWIRGAGERALTLSIKDANGYSQIFRYDVDTETLTQLTFTPVNKSRSFAWVDPELNELVFMATEADPANRLLGEWVGIYRQINGEWTRVKIIKPPSQKVFLGNTEPFVFDGHSYVMLQSVRGPQGFPNRLVGAEIWIAGIDPQVDFYRRVTGNLNTRPNDPEPFVSNSQVFVYYTDATQNSGIIHRLQTGLVSQSPDSL